MYRNEWSRNLINKLDQEIYTRNLTIRFEHFARNSPDLRPNFDELRPNIEFQSKFAYFAQISSILPDVCSIFEHFARIRQFCIEFCPNFEHFARILPKFRAFGPNSPILHQTPPCAIELRSKMGSGTSRAGAPCANLDKDIYIYIYNMHIYIYIERILNVSYWYLSVFFW